MKEVTFYCPHCNAQDSIILDISRPNHNYIIDCEVCGSPYKLHFDFKREQPARQEAMLQLA